MKKKERDVTKYLFGFLKEAVDLLKEADTNLFTAGLYEKTCPFCNGIKRHRRNCKLEAFLKKVGRNFASI